MGKDKLNIKFPQPLIDTEILRSLGILFEPQVIFNNETTIFKCWEQSYKATAKNEPFDEEKGVLICAMKAQYQIKNYTHLRKLIDNAKRYGTAKKDNK